MTEETVSAEETAELFLCADGSYAETEEACPVPAEETEVIPESLQEETPDEAEEYEEAVFEEAETVETNDTPEDEEITVTEEAAAEEEIITEPVTEEIAAEEETPLLNETVVREADAVTGSCGTSCEYEIADGVLRISGSGATDNYTDSGLPGWSRDASQFTKIVVEEGITRIGNYAFAGLSNVTEAELPEGLTSIGMDAFLGCSGITGITLPSSLTEIGYESFYNCRGLTELRIPENVVSVISYAFYQCSGLTSVTLPEGLTNLGPYAFGSCYGLREINIPSGMTEIQRRTFYECRSLTEITIPEGITGIGEDAFAGCSGITTVTLPKSLTGISNGAFYYCGSLTDVYYGGSEESWRGIAIGSGNDPLMNAVMHFLQVTGISLDLSDTNISMGESLQLTATVIPEDALNKTVHWTSSDTAVATVDENGLVTAVALGTAVITATTDDGGYTDTCMITVVIPLESISLDKTELTLNKGETDTLTVTYDPEDTTEDKTVTWTSSDETIATVSDGTVTAVAPGVAHITAASSEDAEINAVCTVIVQFTDVTDPSVFYYDYVYDMVKKGITTGFTDGTFRPMADCNRAAVVTFLWRLEGRPEPAGEANFSDMTSNDEFNKAISWAAEKGITTGWDDGTFRPWNTCNRAAVMTFLWRAAGSPEPSQQAEFSDMTTNDEFNKAISWGVEKGITTGWDDGTFRPWNTCNRLAIVSFLARYAAFE